MLCEGAMSTERERGHHLAESALGGDAAGTADAPRPDFPHVTARSVGGHGEPAAGLERDIARLRHLPPGRAEAEIRFLRERRWIGA
jgi:hypothetical protein